MTAAAQERRVAALVDDAGSADSELDLFERMSARLRQLVPFDGSAWFATDPLTILGTSGVRVENIETGHCESYWDRELTVEDFNLFRDLARTETGVGSLHDTSGGQRHRSARFREFLSPQGYGDDLRAAFRVNGSTWGVVDLYRDESAPRFSEGDRALVRRVSTAIGTALRGLSVRTSVRVDDAGPGTALFAAGGELVSLDDQADALIGEIADPNWSPSSPVTMTPVLAVLGRAVAVAEGRDAGPASTRVRAASGRWLALHASCLRGTDGRPGLVALTIEPAKSAQIAPIIVEAYSLTPREQDITRAVARGLSNLEIAAELFLSPHTVRDHLKAIFAKVGVASRGELVARLFAEHYAPRLHQREARATF